MKQELIEQAAEMDGFEKGIFDNPDVWYCARPKEFSKLISDIDCMEDRETLYQEYIDGNGDEYIACYYSDLVKIYTRTIDIALAFAKRQKATSFIVVYNPWKIEGHKYQVSMQFESPWFKGTGETLQDAIIEAVLMAQGVKH